MLTPDDVLRDQNGMTRVAADALVLLGGACRTAYDRASTTGPLDSSEAETRYAVKLQDLINDLARQLLDAREALREALHRSELFESASVCPNMESFEDWRACLPEYQEDA